MCRFFLPIAASRKSRAVVCSLFHSHGLFLYRYIVFEGEEGQDAGGLLREWYMIISREMFNPMYALFRTSPGDRVTYTINPSSHCNPNHLSYFKFVGRVVAKAVYDNRLLECYFTRSFYKHILGKSVRYQQRLFSSVIIRLYISLKCI